MFCTYVCMLSWEVLSHHLNLGFAQRATDAIPLERRLSDPLAHTLPPTISTNSLTFVLRRHLDWFARECSCILQSLDLNIVVRFHLFYSSAEEVIVLI